MKWPDSNTKFIQLGNLARAVIADDIEDVERLKDSDEQDLLYYDDRGNDEDYYANDVDQDNCNVNEYFSEEEQKCVPTNRAEDEDNNQDMRGANPICQAHEVWSEQQEKCVPINSNVEDFSNSQAVKGGSESGAENVSTGSMAILISTTLFSIFM